MCRGGSWNIAPDVDEATLSAVCSAEVPSLTFLGGVTVPPFWWTLGLFTETTTLHVGEIFKTRGNPKRITILRSKETLSFPEKPSAEQKVPTFVPTLHIDGNCTSAELFGYRVTSVDFPKERICESVEAYRQWSRGTNTASEPCDRDVKQVGDFIILAESCSGHVGERLSPHHCNPCCIPVIYWAHIHRRFPEGSKRYFLVPLVICLHGYLSYLQTLKNWFTIWTWATDHSEQT